jgi:hypothetical protein
MTPRKLSLLAVALVGCIRQPQQFATPTEEDPSIVFPLSVGEGLFEVKPRSATYDLDGDVLRALMIAGNDYIPPGIPDAPCWARLESLKYRFTRRDDVLFVYVSEDFARCGLKSEPIHSGAKYAIHTDGRILRRIIDGVDSDQAVWRLRAEDGGTVTVVAEPGVRPGPEDIGKPDSGILQVVTEPVTMPGWMILERVEGSQPVAEDSGVTLGDSWLPSPPTDVGHD